MRKVIVTLKGISPYCQSGPMTTPKNNKEKDDAYDERCWRDRIHATTDGFVEIPPIAFKYAIDSVGKKLRMKVPGKGGSEYTNLLKGGVVVKNGVRLPIKKEDVVGVRHFLNADGKRGGGTRVWRRIPTIMDWEGEMTFVLVDDAIEEEVFEAHLREAGMLIGVGQNRPENGGFCGRFVPTKFTWSKAELE